MRLSTLGPEGTQRIDQAARRILERTGVEIPHAEMQSLFRQAGANVDVSSRRVRIPSSVVDQCLRTAGKTFTIYGRDRGLRAAFGVGQRSYNTTAGQAHWVEGSGDRRFASLDDVAAAAKIGDVLPMINIVGAMADPHELDVSWRCVDVAATLLRTTTKPVTFWFHDGPSAAYLVQLMDVVTAGQTREFPPAYPLLEPISPLRFPTNGIDVLLETCKVPRPVHIGPMAQLGLSAPATIAGTLAQETAEILAGVCVTQLIRPGTPVCFGGIPHVFDMKTTQLVFSGPEQGLMAVAMTEMGRHYGLPVYINVGLTDSKTVDAQAGLEIGVSLVLGALAGADIFGHFGICGVDQGASLEMLVFQHEVIEFVERILRGFQIDDETLALDLIDAVGPGGSFIAEDHTLRHFRQELWMPKLLDRLFWDAWVARGRADTLQRARRPLESLIASYEPKPLPADVERQVAELVARAKRDLARTRPIPRP